MIIILTSEDDVTADLVIEHLPSDGVLRLEPAGLPGRVDLTARVTAGGEVTGRITAGPRSVALEEITAVWWRRPGTPGADAEVQREFVGLECERALYGALRALPIRWMNHPEATERSRYKLWQLRLAAECGMRIPPTLMTTVPNAAEGFAAGHGPLIVKSVSGRHPEDPPLTLRTSRVDPEADFADVAACVTCLQPELPKVFDIRLTVVGEAMFACRIEPHAAGTLDWRFEPVDEVRWTLVPVPGKLGDAVLAYMRRAGLAYAAFDFAVDQDSTWWFLEANSSGQFGFVDLTAGSTIARSIARWLTAAP